MCETNVEGKPRAELSSTRKEDGEKDRWKPQNAGWLGVRRLKRANLNYLVKCELD